ncbi:MAG: hypothetical protein AAGA15_10375 [Pseudomonadota bacterium]
MALNTTLPGANTARKVGMVSGTFAVAMGIGFFMQQQDVSASRNSAQSLTPPPDVAVAAVGQLPQVDALPTVVPALQPPETNAQATAPDAPQITPVAADPSVAPEEGASAAPEALAEEVSCEPSMTARVLDAALVELTVAAPCADQMDFTMHHEGMMFSGRTSPAGEATIIAPALSTSAVYIAAFEQGLGAVAEAEVPALAQYDRVVLQWSGEGGFEIHAMEYGANYGEPGHVWQDAPRTASIAATGAGGFLITLGDGRVDAPRFAQVYTFPSSTAPKPAKVALSVEAEVTPSNCATDVEAQTLERHASGGSVKIVDLTLAVPECEAVGDFLVLKNILGDLTLSNG